MDFPRAVDFDGGVAMVVTDLHGAGTPFDHLCDTFLNLRAAGRADYLVFCGDLIHGYGSEADDESLRMLQRVMQLQAELGQQTVTLLLGNHEFPHIYNITLAKGNLEFTARFERALTRSGQRDMLLAFLRGLPFVVRTAAGVLITHAGATPAVIHDYEAEQLLTVDHDALLALAESKLQNGYDLDALKRDSQYRQQAMHYLALESPDDPRFHHLLRGQLISQSEEEFRFMWDVFFSQNEQGFTPDAYAVVQEAYLRAFSDVSHHPQRVIVSGHIAVRGGHEIIGERQLRLASYAHATPHESGEFLLLDCATPVYTVDELLPHLHPIYP